MQSYGSLLLRSGVKSLQAANTKTLDDWRVCLRRVNFDKNEYVRFELGGILIPWTGGQAHICVVWMLSILMSAFRFENGGFCLPGRKWVL